MEGDRTPLKFTASASYDSYRCQCPSKNSSPFADTDLIINRFCFEDTALSDRRTFCPCDPHSVSTSHISGPPGGARLLTVPVHKQVPMAIYVVASSPHAYRSGGAPSHAQKGEPLPDFPSFFLRRHPPTDKD